MDNHSYGWDFIVALFALGVLSSNNAFAADYSIEQDIGGISSVYTNQVIALAQKDWSNADLEFPIDTSPIRIQCLADPSHEFYIGVMQVMDVNAPLKRVAEVIDDFASYSSLLKDNMKSEFRQVEGNLSLVTTEQHISIPFVENDKTEMAFVVKDFPNKRIYRFQLKSGNHLVAHDGLVILLSRKEGGTRFIKFNFWDANWGLAKVLAPEGIWKESVRGLFQSDLAFKLRSENPDWTLEKVFNQSQDESEKLPVANLIHHKIPAKRLMDSFSNAGGSNKNPNPNISAEAEEAKFP